VTGSPVIAEQVQRYLGIVLPTIALMGLVLVAVTVLEQLGAGLAAVLLNLGYFGAVLVIGGLLARQHHDFSQVYWTIAITNLVGAPLAVPLTATLIRRRVLLRPARVSEPKIPATATEGST
jgi:hypothetical protein